MRVQSTDDIKPGGDQGRERGHKAKTWLAVRTGKDVTNDDAQGPSSYHVFSPIAM